MKLPPKRQARAGVKTPVRQGKLVKGINWALRYGEKPIAGDSLNELERRLAAL